MSRRVASSIYVFIFFRIYSAAHNMTGDIYVFFYSFGLGWLTSFEPRSLPLAAVGVARRACNASKRELLASASVPAEASVAKDPPKRS